MVVQTSFAGGYHYQLDLTAKLVNNPQKELSAIQMSWIYDKELSAILMDGEDLSEAKREETLKKRATDILIGLTDMKYFTSLLLDDQPLEFAKVENYKLLLNDESRLKMNLTIPLKKSQQLKGRTLEIIVTDDSGVGLATFVDTNHLQLGEVFKTECKAPSLVQNQLAEIDGHAQTTETMTVDCR
ncbi:DUF1007 family protein [uncultured Cocleimonas sp.]|uniref:DUF1007 family protein n=1 Tax=uncultured Cocleimonas sp. TaxID=1051587 RepID=UPI002631E118|nr:DUF1007 family protein [uncultured Cocleimonas sp.]